MTDRTEQRTLFVECRLDALDADRSRATVVLADRANRTYEGVGEHAGAEHDLWSVAKATTQALQKALGLPEEDLRLKDVSAFTIDEGPAVAVSLRLRAGGEKRTLFGLNQTEDDRGRAAALAVLGATNRVLGKA
jgi:hypothetical protein